MADKLLDNLTAASSVLDADISYLESGGSEYKLAQSVLKTYISNSPTLVTPNLGTPSAGSLGSCSDYEGSAVASTGETGGNKFLREDGDDTCSWQVITEAAISDLGTTVAMVADNLSVFAATTSAQLAGVISDETGSGALVFADTPTLVTPVLGTPGSGTLTNCTGLPVSTGVSGLGTGVADFLGTPSSANLATAVTDDTGSGALVFATSPTLVTPILGTPTSGTLSNCNSVGKTVTTGITAYAGGGQGSATALTSEINVVATVGTTGDSVKLPTAAAGLEITVINQTTTDANVFPVSGGYIDGIAMNGSVTLTSTSTVTFVAINATNWYTKAVYDYTPA